MYFIDKSLEYKFRRIKDSLSYTGNNSNIISQQKNKDRHEG